MGSVVVVVVEIIEMDDSRELEKKPRFALIVLLEQGLGTDKKTIISIIGHRNAVQRKLIRYAYEEIYQEDLVMRLESELTGGFEKAVYRWMLEPADRDAVLANVAIRQSTSAHHVIIELSCIYSPEELLAVKRAYQARYRVIIELSCIYSPEELLAVKRAYQARYKHSMEEDLAAHTSGDLRKLLVALAGTYRYDGDEVNANLANSEAKVLHNAIKEEVIDQDEVIRIISTRSKAQLKATFNRYKLDYGSSITKHLVDDPANQYLAAVHTVLQCINDPKKYYEKALRSALNKPWIDEDVLTQVIVTRAEKDLKEIKDLYYKRSSESLDHAVAKDTSGDYKAFLLTLLGNQD